MRYPWKMNGFNLLCMVLLLANGAWAAGQELRSTLADQQQVAVTIYNDDLALVRDQRRLVLPEGVSKVALRDVSARIRPETALLKSLDGRSGFGVLEQNFDFDLLTPEKLLEKYVGRTVRVVRVHPQTGVESENEALVLSAQNGVVLQLGDRIETGVPGRIVYPDVPADLRDRPTLVVTVTGGSGSSQLLELAYLTGGLSWRADYVAELSPQEDRLNLSAWVTLTNQSGTSYRDARLQLVAGDVNRVAEQAPLRRKPKAVLMEMAASEPAMQEEGLFEYHLYTLGRSTTLLENQTKQVALLTATAVPVRKEFLLRGSDYYYSGSYGELGRRLKVATYLEFDNREQTGLGQPLPKGVMRVYKQDRNASPQFIGEDSIEHTPKNETLRLKLGDAFDLTADRTQTDFKKLTSSRYNYVFESAYRIELRNAKSEAVTVKVLEPLPGDWEIVGESLPHRQDSAGSASWQVAVPAEGKTVLEYRVRVKY